MQEKAIRLAESGANIFLTGKAGTGKSWTTKQIVSILGQTKFVHTDKGAKRGYHKRGKVVHVTAPTGMAAINVGGTTINRWGGYGLGSYYSDYDRMMSKENRQRICHTDTLVLDEVSMVSGHSFDVLECMVAIIRNYDDIKDRLKELRDNARRHRHQHQGDGSSTLSVQGPGGAGDTGVQQDEDREGGDSLNVNRYVLDQRWEDPSNGGLGDIAPWGGLQLILIGDFAQLPPVPNKPRKGAGDVSSNVIDDDLVDDEAHARIGTRGTYAFQSRAWSRSNLKVVELVKVHRQVQDDGLLEFLNDVREGKRDLAATHFSVISSLRAPLPDRDDGIIPTELHSTNKFVDSKNKRELDKIRTEGHNFTSKDDIELHERYKKRLLRKHRLEEVAYMPYLWAIIEKPMYPARYGQAKGEMSALETTKKQLLKEEKYEEIIAIRDKLKEPEEEVKKIEKDYKLASEITLSSINEWLSKNKSLAPNAGSAMEISDKVGTFQKQLRKDYSDFKHHADERFFGKECRVARDIELKVNAQVMLLWNLDIESKLVNGSRGIVVGFLGVGEYKRLLVDELEHRMRNSQPKFGGDGTPKANEKSPKEQPEERQGNCPKSTTNERDSGPKKNEPADPADPKRYRPLSSSLDDESIDRIISSIGNMLEEQLQAELRKLDDIGPSFTEFPFVKYESTAKLILPTPFQKDFRGFFKATRWQIPLGLAWALSIHKSQGMVRKTIGRRFFRDSLLPFKVLPMHLSVLHIFVLPSFYHSIFRVLIKTIDYLKANLSGCFSPGQAYVACSRGRSAATMQIENFHENQIITSEVVKEFYDALSRKVEYRAKTWAEHSDKDEETNQIKRFREKVMKREYGNRRCRLCSGPCDVKMVMKETSGNFGKWYVRCSSEYGKGHTFDFVPEVDL